MHAHTATGTSDPPSRTTTAPPPTPQIVNGNKPQISPAMIQTALEALQQIEDKKRPLSLTPGESVTSPSTTPVLSEAVTSALTAWISRQNSSVSSNATPLVSPPPSSPLETSTEVPCRPISASDLIAALSSLIPSTAGTTATMTSSSSVSLHEAVRSVGGKRGERGEEGGRKGREVVGGGERESEVGGSELVKSKSCENSNPCTVPASTPQVFYIV